MDNDALEAMIREHARQAGMSPVELTQKTLEILGIMQEVNLSEFLPMQMSEFTEAAKRLAQQRKDLRERMKNGARRTSGNIRLPV